MVTNHNNFSNTIKGDRVMEITESKHSSEKEVQERQKFMNKFKNSPIPEPELVRNLGLFLNRIGLMRILFMFEM